MKLKAILIYPIYEKIAATYWEHIEAFQKFSKLDIDFFPINTIFPINVDLSNYDCIILHYGLCLYNQHGLIDQSLFAQIAQFPKLKVYIAQDEYTTPRYAVAKLKALGVHHVFSCISDEKAFREIYPISELPNLTFDTVLTGYVNDELLHLENPPLEERPLDIVYRGNNLGWLYGALGAEKFKIAMDFRELAKKFNLKIDIDWRPKAKIFGDKWLKFLQKGKVMLCTESGSSLVHHDLEAKAKLFETMQISGEAKTWEEYLNKVNKFNKFNKFNCHLRDDNKVIISGISPKVFEAIACGTVLVCNEGYYSGILKPNTHYIPLKKDLSNIEEVITKIKDIEYLKKIQNQAYEDIISSGKYSYENFISSFDQKIHQLFDQLKFEKVFYISVLHKPIIKKICISKKFAVTHPVSYTIYYFRKGINRLYRIIKRLLTGCAGLIIA
ncbi:MAG: tuaH [Candidatus Midichloriaceae bacterium]|jgi:hypothetical protein|nr:tuaH [Candidatus Midichloriaceae bacterium]